MNDAPERIWRWWNETPHAAPNNFQITYSETGEPYPDGAVEYIRADLADAMVAAAYEAAAMTPTYEDKAGAALSYRHDFGLLHRSDQEALISTAGWWHNAWSHYILSLTTTHARAEFDRLIAGAIAAERERCAKIADQGERDDVEGGIASWIAMKIRSADDE